jgi:hypothetical protein
MLFWAVILNPVQTALMSVKTFPHPPDPILLMDMLAEGQQQRVAVPGTADSLAHADSGLNATRAFWLDALGGPVLDPYDFEDLDSLDFGEDELGAVRPNTPGSGRLVRHGA